MPILRGLSVLLAVLWCGVPFAACGGPPEEAAPAPSSASASEALSALGRPPARCTRRRAGATAIEAVVRIDRYQGLIRGKNGTHEIAFGTITSTPWVVDAGVVDTARVQLALHVATQGDPGGLPAEVPLGAGETVRVEGEYVPASRANVRRGRGPTAVIHSTHAPCGFVVINGRKYR
ncbi:MAG: hypothetical protein NVSMB23_05630 [Myxococcales bacterium]